MQEVDTQLGIDELISENLRLKMALNSLVELTKAINSNPTEDELYHIFSFTILAQRIDRISLLILSEEGKLLCKKSNKMLLLDEGLHAMKQFAKEISPVRLEEKLLGLEQVNWVLPIVHQGKLRGYLAVGQELNPSQLDHISTLSNVLMVAVENRKMELVRQEREAHKRELEFAHEVQKGLVPDKLPNDDVLEMFAYYQPHSGISGDYYDYIPLGKNKFFCCIADAAGKGIPAALQISNFQAALRVLLQSNYSLEDIVRRLHDQVYDNKETGFVTFFGAIVDLENQVMQYITAGHNPPVLIQDGKCHLLTKGCSPLGARKILPFLSKGEIAIRPGDLFYAYTDGVTEIKNAKGEDYGDQRLRDFLLDCVEDDLEDIHDDLLLKLVRFKGKLEFPDDLTVFAFRLK